MLVSQEEETETDENEDDSGNEEDETRTTGVTDATIGSAHLVSKPEPDQKHTDDDTGYTESFERTEP